jgi:anthranilate phosphoribosyltransferase
MDMRCSGIFWAVRESRIEIGIKIKIKIKINIEKDGTAKNTKSTKKKERSRKNNPQAPFFVFFVVQSPRSFLQSFPLPLHQRKTMPITPQEALQRTIEHREIFHDEMVDLMRQIMRGEVSPTLIAAIVAGLRVKKETVGEIAAAATVMRELAAKVPRAGREGEHLVDIVGTGGDGANTFNISTASMFVVAAAGARAAKPGNRGVSSKSGSADVLEALGVAIDLSPEDVARCLDETGIGFMFAPNHHPAMKAVAPVRRELGVRTLFNILGPLTNPAGAPNILMGVFHADLVGIQARVLQRLGARRAMIVWGRDGIDEISLGAPTAVAELRDGAVREYDIDPADFGLARSPTSALAVADAMESRVRVLEALENREGAARDIVALNAGAALAVSGTVDSIAEGVIRAREVLASGAARAKLDAFAETTRRLAAAR